MMNSNELMKLLKADYVNYIAPTELAIGYHLNLLDGEAPHIQALRRISEAVQVALPDEKLVQENSRLKREIEDLKKYKVW
jgi:hypothetical protein